jgi:plastocyanin
MRRAWIVMVVVAAAAVGACGSGGTTSPAPGALPVEPIAGTLTLLAKDIAFTPSQVTMTSDTALTVVLDNEDAGVPHDATLFGGADTKIAATDVVSGVAQAKFSIPPLVPGQYRLSCTVHPNMTATLTVVAPS